MASGRRCPRCHRIITNGAKYCAIHAAEYETSRGTPTARGYDATHRATRVAWQGRIDAGEVVRCASCGVRIVGTAWDLGHTADRTAYIGPQCQTCNRSDGGRRGRAMQDER